MSALGFVIIVMAICCIMLWAVSGDSDDDFRM